MLNRIGLTLIELLIVVAIIGILAAIAVPNFLNAMTRARISRSQEDIRNITTSLETYKLYRFNEIICGVRYRLGADAPLLWRNHTEFI